MQALNEFLVFGTVALSSFSSGALLTGFGWQPIQIAVLPFVALCGFVVLWLKLRPELAVAAEGRVVAR